MIYVTPTIFPGEPGVKKYWIAGGSDRPRVGVPKIIRGTPEPPKPQVMGYFYVASRGGGACQVAGLIRG